MMASSIITEVLGTVATITINNPKKRNALTCQMWRDLRSEIVKHSANPKVRCLIVTGASGGGFAAGADIDEFPKQRMSRDKVVVYHEEIVGPALYALISSDVVSIALIDGDCMGGGLEIAMACDLRYASESSRFGAAVARLGFPLAFGETEILVRKFGSSLAAELLLEARVLNSSEAQTKGLVHQIAEGSELHKLVAEAAENISDLSPYALKSMKQQLRRLLFNSAPVDAEERNIHYSFAETSDYLEGYSAFVNKRKPHFTGQ